MTQPPRSPGELPPEGGAGGFGRPGVAGKESVLSFVCEGEPLVGILAEPDGTPAEVGVVIIVGGPQYRAGSHRQFTLLARHLAARGFAVLRFDYRSMQARLARSARTFADAHFLAGSHEIAARFYKISLGHQPLSPKVWLDYARARLGR